jgi:predicted nuclease of predicted toxin-antitoxin system
MARRAVIAFLTDQNVPDSVGQFLKQRGHDVVRLRDIMPTDSADPVVAEAAMQAGRVLVSWDKDFNHQRFMKPRFSALSRLAFSCLETEAVARLKIHISLIEAEVRLIRTGKPMRIRIGSDKIQIGR